MTPQFSPAPRGKSLQRICPATKGVLPTTGFDLTPRLIIGSNVNMWHRRGLRKASLWQWWDCRLSFYLWRSPIDPTIQPLLLQLPLSLSPSPPKAVPFISNRRGMTVRRAAVDCHPPQGSSLRSGHYGPVIPNHHGHFGWACGFVAACRRSFDSPSWTLLPRQGWLTLAQEGGDDGTGAAEDQAPSAPGVDRQSRGSGGFGHSEQL